MELNTFLSELDKRKAFCYSKNGTLCVAFISDKNAIYGGILIKEEKKPMESNFQRALDLIDYSIKQDNLKVKEIDLREILHEKFEV